MLCRLGVLPALKGVSRLVVIETGRRYGWLRTYYLACFSLSL